MHFHVDGHWATLISPHPGVVIGPGAPVHVSVQFSQGVPSVGAGREQTQDAPGAYHQQQRGCYPHLQGSTGEHGRAGRAHRAVQRGGTGERSAGGPHGETLWGEEGGGGGGGECGRVGEREGESRGGTRVL